MAGDKWPIPWLWIFSFFFVLSGCAEPEIPTLPSLSFEEVKQRVSQIRGLPFQPDVSLEIKGKEEIQQLLEKSFAEEQEEKNLSTVARVYTRLGLLTEGTDLSKALLELSLFRQSFHYDPRRKTILLPRQPQRPALAFLGFPQTPDVVAEQFLLIHGLAHILQEQHFGWRERLKSRRTKDLELALRALMKGDALLVGLTHLTGNPKESREKIVGRVKDLSRLAAFIDKELAHLPALMRQKATLEHIQGSQFVLWAFSIKGWDGVNELFSHPPLSTEQILHPEKYFVKRKNPVRITPWGLIRQLRGKKIMDETLGEFLIQSLLSQTLSKAEAAQAAAGWAGDSLLAYEQGEEFVLGWITAWDNQAEASEFYRSYRRALERRYGLSMESTSANAQTLTTPLQRHPSLLLEIRENLVFFLDGIPPPRSVEIADALWKDLEVGSEPQPFEVAKR